MSSTFLARDEVRVNTITTNDQSRPALAVLADGSWVAVWQTARPLWETDGRLPYETDIHFQRFAADGTPLGPEQVAFSAALEQIDPVVAALPDGGFTIAFASETDYDGRLRSYDFGVLSREFDASGAARGEMHSWSGGQLGDQDRPTLAVQADGSVLVAYTTAGSAEIGMPAGVVGPAGLLAGGTDAAITALSGSGSGGADGWALAWSGSDGVHLQTGAGSAVWANVEVAGPRTGHPAIAALADGTLMLAWEAPGSGPMERDVLLRHYSAQGSWLGDVVNVTEQPAGDQAAPAVSALPGGGFVVAWEAPDGDSRGVFYRQYDAMARPLGAVTQVNASSQGDQFGPSIVATPGGGFTVAYTSNASGDLDVLARHYDLPVDWSAHQGMAFRLYQAALDRVPDLAGLKFHTQDLDAGVSLGTVAAHFIQSPEFQSRYGALDDTNFVTQLYENVLHRAPDAAGLTYHVGHLAEGVARENVLTGFSESPENQALVIGSFQAAMPDLG